MEELGEMEEFKHSVAFIENIIQVQGFFFPYDSFPSTRGLTYFLYPLVLCFVLYVASTHLSLHGYSGLHQIETLLGLYSLSFQYQGQKILFCPSSPPITSKIRDDRGYRVI